VPGAPSQRGRDEEDGHDAGQDISSSRVPRSSASGRIALLPQAVGLMVERDIGSLLVMERERWSGCSLS